MLSPTLNGGYPPYGSREAGSGISFCPEEYMGSEPQYVGKMEFYAAETLSTEELMFALAFGNRKNPKLSSEVEKPLPMLTRNCLSLLLWVLFNGGILMLLHSQPQRISKAESRKNVVTNPERRIPTLRVKRGWVWNQFFVLEEYMGSEPQYVGK
ncbi:hypothetical protein E2320_011009, partial [Naja naja]